MKLTLTGSGESTMLCPLRSCSSIFTVMSPPAGQRLADPWYPAGFLFPWQEHLSRTGSARFPEALTAVIFQLCDAVRRDHVRPQRQRRRIDPGRKIGAPDRGKDRRIRRSDFHPPVFRLPLLEPDWCSASPAGCAPRSPSARELCSRPSAGNSSPPRRAGWRVFSSPSPCRYCHCSRPA